MDEGNKYEERGVSFSCRVGCGACCIAISISSPLPGLPGGKAAGVRCVNLDKNNLCRVHGTEAYPPVCRAFKASLEMCGETREEALAFLARLEEMTSTPGNS